MSADKNYSPPASRSGEINLIQEAIQVAVQSTIQAMTSQQNGPAADACRKELDAIRNELKSDFEDLRTDIKSEFTGINERIGEMRTDLADGKTSFALINQRMTLEKEARDREQTEKRRRDNTPAKNYLVQPPASGDPDDRPLIPTKVVNALILAAVAAAGASLWALGSAWLSDKVATPAKTAPAAVAPVKTPP